MALDAGLGALVGPLDSQVRAVLEALAMVDTSSRGSNQIPHDPTKSLARIAAVSFLEGRFRPRVPRSDAVHAFALKAAYVYLQDALDHVIDHGTYGHEAAVRLYRHCLASTTERGADLSGLEERLRETMNPTQVEAAAPLAHLTRIVRDAILGSPNGPALRPYLSWVNGRFAQAQTASVFQRRERLDPKSIRRIASRFWSPDPDLVWHERFAAHLSWVTNLSLLDLCYARRLPPEGELRNHMLAWYYFDAVISYLDHLADLSTHDREGIVNDAFLSMGESQSGWTWTDSGRADRLELSTQYRFVTRVVEFERRALRLAFRSHALPEGFYPVLGLMIPVVMLARCEAERAWILHAYVRRLAPVLRKAIPRTYHRTSYSQHSSPRRTHLGFATVPWNPRDSRMPS